MLFVEPSPGIGDVVGTRNLHPKAGGLVESARLEPRRAEGHCISGQLSLGAARRTVF